MTIIYDLSKVPADVVAQIHASPKFTKWFSEFPTKLLGVSGDAKTVKGEQVRCAYCHILWFPCVIQRCQYVCYGCRMLRVSKRASTLLAGVLCLAYRCLGYARRYSCCSIWDDFKAMLLREIERHAKYCRQAWPQVRCQAQWHY